MESYDPNKPPPDTDANPGTRKSFGAFLKESDVKPLVFVGKCMDYFGMGAVVGFILGGTAVYGLSLFDLLPYPDRFRPNTQVQTSATPATATVPKEHSAEPTMITVRGVVSDSSGVVKEPFQVGVVQKVYGDFTRGDGSYYLEVPRGQSLYKLAFWKGNYENLRVVEVLLENENNFSPAFWYSREVNLAAKRGGATTSSKVVERGRKTYPRDTIFSVGAPSGSILAFQQNHVTLSVE